MTTTEPPVQGTFAGMPQRLYAASPSRLLTWLDCPRRFRMTYLDRPRPAPRPQRAHTTVGIITHNVLRDFWDAAPADRTPDLVKRLVEAAWSPVGFRDEEQSRRWRTRVTHQVTAYLKAIDRDRPPIGIERTVAFRGPTIAFSGRIDRLDDRAGELVVVDYKTGRRAPTDDDARTSLALGLYAVAVERMWRRPCRVVELHHVPTGAVAAHEHDERSLARKVDEAESIARDLRALEARHAQGETSAADFPAVLSPLCSWCDLRAHCPEGSSFGAEKSDWAGLAGEGETERPGPERPDLERLDPGSA